MDDQLVVYSSDERDGNTTQAESEDEMSFGSASLEPRPQTRLPTFHQNAMQSLINNDKFSDVAFLVGADEETATEFHTVRALLAVHSEVFARMLFGNMIESKSKYEAIVRISDVSPNIFEWFIKFVCGLNPSIEESNAIGLYYFSEKYMIEQLNQVSFDFIVDSVIDSKQPLLNVIESLTKCGLSSKIGDVLNKIGSEHGITQDQCAELLKSDYFLNMDDKLIAEWLFEGLNIHRKISSENMFLAIQRWAKYQCNTKKNRNKKKNKNNYNYSNCITDWIICLRQSALFKHISFKTMDAIFYYDYIDGMEPSLLNNIEKYQIVRFLHFKGSSHDVKNAIAGSDGWFQATLEQYEHGEDQLHRIAKLNLIDFNSKSSQNDKNDKNDTNNQNINNNSENKNDNNENKNDDNNYNNNIKNELKSNVENYQNGLELDDDSIPQVMRFLEEDLANGNESNDGNDSSNSVDNISCDIISNNSNDNENENENENENKDEEKNILDDMETPTDDKIDMENLLETIYTKFPQKSMQQTDSKILSPEKFETESQFINIQSLVDQFLFFFSFLFFCLLFCARINTQRYSVHTFK